jgi:hypothetical protein
MACSCSKQTDVRGRCNPFDKYSVDCPMRIDSFFWCFHNNSDFEDNVSKIDTLNKYYSPSKAIHIYTKFVVEYVLSDLVDEGVISSDIATEFELDEEN